MLVDLLRALLGISCLIGLCALLSEKRGAINWRLVGGGMSLQLLLALLFLVVPGGSQAFNALASFFVWITGFSRDGATFVFGPLADPAAERGPGFIFAFQVLPTIIFFSALCSLLDYRGVLQKVVWAFAWLIGVPGADVREIGSLLGSKVVFNEFVAYTQLGELKAAGLADPAVALDPKSIFLATFALSGFANFSSIGIQLGGTGSLAPNQRPTLAALGFKAVLGGTVTTLITATLAGAFYPWVA